MQAMEFHYDGGHGWLRVTHEQIEAVCYRPTTYSYFDDRHVFLEEDLDAGAFRDMWIAEHGEMPTVEIDDGSRSFIRKLTRCPVQNRG